MTNVLKLLWKIEKFKGIFNMNNNKQILRFITAGNVDDGKSTLIGRLLYDGKFLQSDQIETVENISKKKGVDFNFALLTDGLKSEREQGITIDIAHRYFETDKRKFIISDSPGHAQYTRNMVTAASNANLAIILIDARNGVTEQTCRHFFICSMLQIYHVVFCINKMDLINYDESIYNKIKDDINEFSKKLNIKDIQFIPVSALSGENIINRSENMNWYKGTTLMYILENAHIESDYNYVDSRFPVQCIIRPEKNVFHDFRGYAGQISGGIFRKGDEVIVYPSEFGSKIKSIEYNYKDVEEAFYPMSVVMTLEDDIDIERGNLITKKLSKPEVSQDLDLMICWFDKDVFDENKKYILRHTTNECKCIIKDVQYKIDINTLHKIEENKQIKMNDIAKIKLKSIKPIVYDCFSKNKTTGGIILVDEFTNRTVAAGVII